ncbi:MAG TPA: glycosyltransferase, partial [Steroidobacteraceae bacterium]|nr:glycosyltransferase [Steroidobacteraceae bacterium]
VGEPPESVRVLLLSDVYFPRVNGVSTSICTFRSDLAALGVETVLVAPAYPSIGGSAAGGASAGARARKAGSTGGESGNPPGLDVGPDEPGTLRVAAAAVPGDPEDRRMRLAPLRAALAQLAAQRFDLVHVQTPFVAHYAGVRFARAQRIPVIASYHTLFEEYLHHYVRLLPRSLGRALARSFSRSQCAHLAAVVAPSTPLRERLLEYGVAARIEVIPTGLPPERYLPGDGARFRASLGVGARQPLLLYVGRVAHEKNIDFLLRVLVRLHATHPETRLVIAGEGPARAHLQELARRLDLDEQVLFVGYLQRTGALADCYAAADVFVFASRTETQGLVLLEALAQGRPVVSTAHLGTASVLREGCGACIVPEEPAAFAAAIAAVLEDRALSAQLSAQARAYAYTWASARMAERLADLYRELRARTRPARRAG